MNDFNVSQKLMNVIERIRPPDQEAEAAARARHDLLTKPKGSLGRLEEAGARLAAIYGSCPPPVPEPAAVAVFAGDHGVLKQGVSPWPAEVTAQMVANFATGGAAVNVLARHAGVRVVVVDVGVGTELPPPARSSSGNVWHRKVRSATADLSMEPAMTLDEAQSALLVGAEVARELVEDGIRCLLTGDMGIGNTTSSAALIAAFTAKSAQEVTGRGTGIDDERLALKTGIVARAVEGLGDLPRSDPLAVLAKVGGLEIAALAGYVLEGAASGVPVVLDGVIACAAALSAAAIAPGCVPYLFAGHRSTEPGASVALSHLGLEPLLDLDLRLGEGTGACLALPLLQAAAKILGEMATFEDAGVTDDHA